MGSEIMWLNFGVNRVTIKVRKLIIEIREKVPTTLSLRLHPDIGYNTLFTNLTLLFKCINFKRS